MGPDPEDTGFQSQTGVDMTGERETARYLLSVVAAAGWSNWGRVPSVFNVIETWAHLQWVLGIKHVHKVMADGAGGGTSR